MKKWIKKILKKLKLIKQIIFEDELPAPKVTNRDIDLDEINSRNDKIRQVLSDNENKEEEIVCPNCKAKVHKLVKCVKCGKEICEDCGTYCSGPKGEDDIVTAKPGYYCEDCW